MNLPPNTRLVTKREIALGLLSKPIYRGDGSCERYMSDGETVSFQVLKHNSDFNAEFTINGDPCKKIWLSQLNPLYLAAEGRSLHCGKIVFKGGGEQLLGNMLVNDFIDAVDGKRFQVVAHGDLYAIDRWSPKCQSLGTYGEIRDYICDALDEGRYQDVQGMTKSMTCYDLYEV